MHYIPGLWIFILSAFILLLIMLFSWTKWRMPIGKAFLLLIASAFIWVVAFILELTAITLPMKLLFARIQFIGIIFIPIAWIYLALIFSSRTLSPLVWIFVYAVAAISLVFVFIPFPNLFWGNPTLTNAIINYDYGFWFYFVLEPFVYILLIYSLFIFAQMFVRSSNIYRNQILLIIMGTLLPALVNLLYVFGITPVENINYSTATLSITGMLFGWALFRYKFLDLIPMARDILVETMADPAMLLDNNHRIVDVNPAAKKILGDEKEIVGHFLGELTKNNVGTNIALHLHPSLDSKSSKDLITIGTHFYDCAVTTFSRGQEMGNAYIIILHDVTERELLYRQIEEISRRDPLTGVFNRGELEKRVNQMCRTSYSHNIPLTLIMLDIDFFKEINDTYGHDAGDQALEMLAKILFKTVQPADVVGRFGGDEFIISALHCDSTMASVLAESIRTSVAMCQLHADGNLFSMQVSLGIVTVGEGNTIKQLYEWNSLLVKVDKALYKAKQQGKNQFVVFSP
ncbi:MAG: diguanylate cyclase [Sphaerochaetaceae bacterium]|nr:diguanylate cyclase [Sphaerochaetaceae bacterium]